MSNFKDADDFRGFVAQFDYNRPTRMALPLLISTKIRGIGFALACDTLKELGFLSYPKPDVHLIEVFSKLGLSADEVSKKMSNFTTEFRTLESMISSGAEVSAIAQQ